LRGEAQDPRQRKRRSRNLIKDSYFEEGGEALPEEKNNGLPEQ
jgi:hypothetical protein